MVSDKHASSIRALALAARPSLELRPLEVFILFFFSWPTDPPSQETGRWESKHLVYGRFVPWSFRSENKESSRSSLGLKNESIKQISGSERNNSCTRNDVTVKRNDRIPNILLGWPWRKAEFFCLNDQNWLLPDTIINNKEIKSFHPVLFILYLGCWKICRFYHR